jgi:hypothetical protein
LTVFFVNSYRYRDCASSGGRVAADHRPLPSKKEHFVETDGGGTSMRRLARVAGVAVLAGVLAATGAAPAHAATDWQLAGTFGWNDHCLGVGHQGTLDGSWTSYFCETVTPANPSSGPGYYKLWVR